MRSKIKKITIDIADTPDLLARGLMGVKTLPEDHGMLFKFPSMLQPSFWGKNTYIPLDIAFIRDGRIVDIRQISPMSTRSIASNDICSMAIETNAGFFKKNNIDVGNEVEIKDKEVFFAC